MRFIVCELQTGVVIDEYPLEVTQRLERKLGTYKAGEFGLPVLHKQCPDNWAETLVPWRVLILVCDGPDDRIMWAGIPNSRSRSTDPVVKLPAVTVEKYFDRRYMPTKTYTQQDQTSVIARDMADWCADTRTGIGLELDTPASGVKRDRQYHDDEDARILTRLQQLAAVRDGFEWTIDVVWADEEHSRVEKIFRTGYPNLGYVTPYPEFAFDVDLGSSGPTIGFDHEETWGEGSAATHVKVAGDGEGEDKPYSAPIIDTFRESLGWPRLEERKSQQGVIELATLNAYAQGMADSMFGGQSVIEIEARTGQWPTPADITLGDTALINIDTDQLTTSEVWRIIGYAIDVGAETWKPLIARVGEITEDGNG